MGNNGLIDPKPGFSPACCFSGPVQCPATAPVAYKITVATVYTKVCQDSLTAELSWQGGCGPPAAIAGFCPRCRRRPANAVGTCRSAQGSPKHASEPKLEGEDRSSRRLWSLKSEIQSKPEVLVEDQSKCGSPKRESKPEVRVEAGSARRSRNLGFRRYCPL